MPGDSTGKWTTMSHSSTCLFVATARTQLKPSSQQLLPCFTCNGICVSTVFITVLVKASCTGTECHIKLLRKSMQLCQYIKKLKLFTGIIQVMSTRGTVWEATLTIHNDSTRWNWAAIRAGMEFKHPLQQSVHMSLKHLKHFSQSAGMPLASNTDAGLATYC